MNLKAFDWRTLQRFLSPQATSDLNAFLEKLPQTAGQTALIAAGIAWAFGAGLGLYTFIETRKLTELRAKLADAKALQPIVPRLKDVPVKADALKTFAETLDRTYPDLTIKQQGTAIYITAGTTASFGQFREAISHVQNGGSGWRVQMDKLCVGRECAREKLGALLKINQVSVEKPLPAP